MELTIVMPVYNEEEIVEDVVISWLKELENLGIEYNFIAYNDGSKDNTLSKLLSLSEKYEKLQVVDKPNSGHGPTILRGYKESNSTWIFQIDSDNEMDCIHFKKLWEKRKDYDLIIGARDNRKNPITRKMVTQVSRKTIRFLYGKGVQDVNSPYRLYRTEKFKKAFNKIGLKTFAPNVILTGFAVRNNYRIYEIPIPCRLRQTGEVSIKKWKLLKAAIRSWVQTVQFRLSL